MSDDDTIILGYACNAAGTTRVVVTVPLSLCDELSWAWNYQCGGAKTGFNIGTQPNATDIVHYGVKRSRGRVHRTLMRVSVCLCLSVTLMGLSANPEIVPVEAVLSKESRVI